MSACKLRGMARKAAPALAVLGCFWLICLVLWRCMGGLFFGPSSYNSYTLQALAWRQGQMSLGRDYPHLELAVYQGDWYVSFPPVPSVPIFFLTFLFGSQTPDALMVKLYALGGALAAYWLLTGRGWKPWQAAFVALMTVAGGSMLPLVMNGAVWYQAQTLAFLFTVLAAALMARGRTSWALLLYALAVGCRPFNVCYGPLLMVLWFLEQPDRRLEKAARQLWPGIALGLAVAAAYAAYNLARFGNPLEFGHNYLPEFVRSEHGQFSLHHLGQNARRFLLGLPLYWDGQSWVFERFGASVFLSNPMLLLLVIRYGEDLARRRTDARAHWTIALFAAHLFLLMLHRTGGGFQLGARYAVDLTPYSLIYLAMQGVGLRRWEVALLAAGFLLMAVGCVQVHI